jgi:hypothetical protein
MFGFTAYITVVWVHCIHDSCFRCAEKSESVILLSTEIYVYDIARTEQNYKTDSDLHYNRTQGAVDAGGQIRRGH